jgi:N-acetylmuramoyl-L-alanine amidase CwlA
MLTIRRNLMEPYVDIVARLTVKHNDIVNVDKVVRHYDISGFGKVKLLKDVNNIYESQIETLYKRIEELESELGFYKNKLYGGW